MSVDRKFIKNQDKAWLKKGLVEVKEDLDKYNFVITGNCMTSFSSSFEIGEFPDVKAQISMIALVRNTPKNELYLLQELIDKELND